MPPATTSATLKPAVTLAAALVPLAVAVVVLRSMGRVWWCACGSLAPWSGDIWSSHNSQHLFDPYTFTHVLHGVAFFAILWVPLRNRSLALRAALAVSIESAWEVIENSEAVIQKYREATISLDYYGDSVLNSIADVGACLLGFAIASRLPWWASLGLFVATELFLGWWIRDSLLLNIVMLVWPLEAIRQWQMGAAA